MRETSHPVFQVEAGRAERGEIGSNFLGDGLWRSHVERSLRPNLMQKGFSGRDGESAGLADAADDLPVARPERFAGLLVGHVDMTRRVYTYRQRRASETLQGLEGNSPTFGEAIVPAQEYGGEHERKRDGFLRRRGGRVGEAGQILPGHDSVGELEVTAMIQSPYQEASAC